MAASTPPEPEAYIIANFARWAGDIVYALERLREVVPPERRTISMQERLASTQDEDSAVERKLAEPRRRREPTELIEAASEEQYVRLARTFDLHGPDDIPN